MATQRSGRGGLAWAIIGGLVLVAGIVAVIITAIVSQSRPPLPPSPGSTSGTTEPSVTQSTSPGNGFVDAGAIEHGWTPEPITTDRDYIRAALAAASTFDTQKSSRDEWLTYLDTWFTPDTRYASDATNDMRASQLELRQAVVLPQEDWDSLANEDGRVLLELPETSPTFRCPKTRQAT